ncbi:MAG: tetratricopeptide repeat protein [Kaistella sp.]
MKKEKVMITKKAVVAALFLGAVSFGYAQTTDSAQTVDQSSDTVQTSQQNPAIDALKKQIEANPTDTEALVKLATAYQDAKDWPNALATWNKMSTLLPDWAPSYYSQAYVYQNMKDDTNAKMSYEKYIAAVKPEEMEASKKNLAYAHYFVAYTFQETDKEQAKQHIAKSLQYDGTNEEAMKLNTFLNQ